MDNQSISNVSINIPEGKVLGLIPKEKITYPNRYQIGSGMDNKRIHEPAIDAIELMSTLTPQEWFVLNTLKNVNKLLKLDDEYKYYSSCIVSTKYVSFTPTQKNQFSTGFKRLKKKDLVRRIKRQEYIINPDFIIPTHYQKELKQWNEL